MENKTQIAVDIREKILKGLEKTFENLLEFKRKHNSVLVISKNGKIVKIKPDKINI